MAFGRADVEGASSSSSSVFTATAGAKFAEDAEAYGRVGRSGRASRMGRRDLMRIMSCDAVASDQPRPVSYTLLGRMGVPSFVGGSSEREPFLFCFRVACLAGTRGQAMYATIGLRVGSILLNNFGGSGGGGG